MQAATTTAIKIVATKTSKAGLEPCAPSITPWISPPGRGGGGERGSIGGAEAYVKLRDWGGGGIDNFTCGAFILADQGRTQCQPRES